MSWHWLLLPRRRSCHAQRPSHGLTWPLEPDPYSGTCTTVDLPQVSRLRLKGMIRRLTRDSERSEISKIFPIDITSSKDVHDIVDNGRGVPFSWYRDIPNTRELCPCSTDDIERPRIVIMITTVSTSEKVQLALVRNEYMARTARWCGCLILDRFPSMIPI